MCRSFWAAREGGKVPLVDSLVNRDRGLSAFNFICSSYIWTLIIKYRRGFPSTDKSSIRTGYALYNILVFFYLYRT